MNPLNPRHPCAIALKSQRGKAMMIDQQTYKVNTTYLAAYSEPLSAQKGEPVFFKRRDPRYSGWLWCESVNGQRGWVPESWIGIMEDGLVMQRDYTAAELSIDAGEELAVDITEAGWGWAHTGDGREGWVPMTCLQKTLHG